MDLPHQFFLTPSRPKKNVWTLHFFLGIWISCYVTMLDIFIQSSTNGRVFLIWYSIISIFYYSGWIVATESWRCCLILSWFSINVLIISFFLYIEPFLIFSIFFYFLVCLVVDNLIFVHYLVILHNQSDIESSHQNCMGSHSSGIWMKTCHFFPLPVSWASSRR